MPMAYQNLHHQLAQGVYQIFNLAGGTVIDVSFEDRKSVKGHPAHGMLNQQWEVEPLGSGYSIRSILNGHYLTVEKGANDGAHIIATPYPISWSVEPFYLERESWVIAWPNAPFVFDLHCGSNKPGETIHLRPRRPAEFCQRWRFVPCQGKYPVDPNAEAVNVTTRSPTLMTETKIHATDPSAQAEAKNSSSSPTTSTVETIVESEGSCVAGDDDLKITTITTSVIKVIRRLTKLESGKTYRIVNVKGKTVIDLNGIDKVTIMGFDAHDGPNQKWLLEWTGQHWTFKSAWNGRYIGIDGQPTDGTRLIAVDHRVEWDIWPDERDKSTYRIFVPGAPAPGINFDLSDYGNPNKGTPIKLYGKWEGEHQTWRFEKV